MSIVQNSCINVMKGFDPLQILTTVIWKDTQKESTYSARNSLTFSPSLCFCSLLKELILLLSESRVQEFIILLFEHDCDLWCYCWSWLDIDSMLYLLRVANL